MAKPTTAETQKCRRPTSEQGLPEPSERRSITKRGCRWCCDSKIYRASSVTVTEKLPMCRVLWASSTPASGERPMRKKLLMSYFGGVKLTGTSFQQDAVASHRRRGCQGTKFFLDCKSSRNVADRPRQHDLAGELLRSLRESREHSWEEMHIAQRGRAPNIESLPHVAECKREHSILPSECRIPFLFCRPRNRSIRCRSTGTQRVELADAAGLWQSSQEA